MSLVWQQPIQRFLLDQDSEQLERDLSETWGEIDPQEKKEIYNFFYHASQPSLFFFFFSLDLEQEPIALPWTKAIKLLRDHGVDMDKNFLKELSQNLYQEKITGKKVYSLSDMLREIQLKEEQDFLEELSQLKKELSMSARIAQSEQLMDEYIKYMKELKKIAPFEYNLSELIPDQEKKRAHRIISQARNRGSKLQKREASMDKESRFILGRLFDQAKALMGQKKVKASDLAYLFHSIGHSHGAIEFINQEDESMKKDWQLLEYLMMAKQSLSVLDHCKKLKKKYEGHPDFIFSVIYSEAFAYWDLGEKEKAVALMGQISSMRPDFKSATETLAQWTQELG